MPDEAAKQAEIAAIAAWCLEVARFLKTPGLVEVIETTAAKRRLAGLRTVKRDLEQWGRLLDDKPRAELNALLRAKFGRGVDETAQDRLKEVKAILKRNKVRSENEHRALQEWVDENHAVDEYRDLIKAVNVLIETKGWTPPKPPRPVPCPRRPPSAAPHPRARGGTKA